MTLFDGQPLSPEEIPARCGECDHTLTQHGPDGEDCSECSCELFY